MDLFSQDKATSSGGELNRPLAERCRPSRLEDFFGHEGIIGEGSALREAILQKRLKSLILWGPPGVGKTTLARIIAQETGGDFVALSAVTSGVADLRKTIERAEKNRRFLNKRTILFIDEIHRFSKAQQDALLHVVEDGTLVLIGATTENPSFEVISPLLSRCQVFQMQPLASEQIRRIVEHAVKTDPQLARLSIEIADWNALFTLADGDARRALNAVERAVDLLSGTPPPLRLTREIFQKASQRKIVNYDKGGEYHYDLISAFIKSLRGSDPDAAVYWMARMLEGGEDPKFIARRMLILAAEDIGNADPQALVLANSCFSAVTYVGMPECRIILSQTATYLACAPKSNAAYRAIDLALATVRENPDLPVPLHLRNAPTDLMKRLDYGKDYRYAHDYAGHFIKENYLPESLKGTIFYCPTTIGQEGTLLERLKEWWSGIKSYPTTEAGKTENQDE